MDPQTQPTKEQTEKTTTQSQTKQEPTQKIQKKLNLGTVDMQKKKLMVEEYIKAQKNNDRRKVKFYQRLLKQHKFWDKQPTLRDDMSQIEHGSIQGIRTLADVPKQPAELPSKNLKWCIIDITDQKQLNQLYELLTNHYVEDDDNTFRFDYSRQFLKWALTPPGYLNKWYVGIRDSERGDELVCSITGVPVHCAVEQDKIKMCEINFLCVHKQFRSQNLAAMLIAQVTRQVNLRSKWQAIYTSGTVLPTPFTQAIYYHRALNFKKLTQIGFSGLAPNQTMAMMTKLYKLPQETDSALRPMVKKDVAGVTQLINNGLNKYVVKFIYTEEEVKHFFMPRDKVVYTYVIQAIDPETKKGKITDMVSFYMLPSHVMKNDKHNMLYACYSFMNFATSVPFDKLILDSLILAKKLGCDVYNCLNLMQNASVFNQLHFQKGDGHLNYYFFNWIMKAKHIQPEQLGVVLF